MRRTRLIFLPGTKSVSKLFCVLLYLSCPNIGALSRERLDFTRDDLYSQSIRETDRNNGLIGEPDGNICCITESRINCENTNFNIGDKKDLMCSDAIQHGSPFATDALNNSCSLDNIRPENDLRVTENFQRKNEIHRDTVRVGLRVDSNRMSQRQRYVTRTSAPVKETQTTVSKRETRRNIERSRNNPSDVDKQGRIDYDRRIRMLPPRTQNSGSREYNDRILPGFRLVRNSSNRNNRDAIRHDMRRKSTDETRLSRNSEEARTFRKFSVEPNEARRSLDRYNLESRQENRRFNWNSRDGRNSNREHSTDEQVRRRLVTKISRRESSPRRVSQERDEGRRTIDNIRLNRNKDDIHVGLSDRYKDDRRNLRKFSRDAKFNRILLDKNIHHNSEQTLHRQDQLDDSRFGSENRFLTSRRSIEQFSVRQNQREDSRLSSENISPRNSDRRNTRLSRDRRIDQDASSRKNRLNIIDKFERTRLSWDETYNRRFNNRQSLDRRSNENDGEQLSHRRLVKRDSESKYNMMLPRNRDIDNEVSNRQKTQDNKIAIKHSNEREISFDRKNRRVSPVQREPVNLSRVYTRSTRREKRSIEHLSVENLAADINKRKGKILNRDVNNRRALREIDNNNNSFNQESRLNREDITIRRQNLGRHTIQRTKTKNHIEQLLSEPVIEKGQIMRRQTRENTFDHRTNIHLSQERSHELKIFDVSLSHRRLINHQDIRGLATAEKQSQRERILFKHTRLSYIPNESLLTRRESEQSIRRLDSKRKLTRVFDDSRRNTYQTDRENRRSAAERSYKELNGDRQIESTLIRNFDNKPLSSRRELVIRKNENGRFSIKGEARLLNPSLDRSSRHYRTITVSQNLIRERRISDKAQRNTNDRYNNENARRAQDDTPSSLPRELRANRIQHVESIIRKDIRYDFGKEFDMRRTRASLHRYINNNADAFQNEINTRRVMVDRRFDRANRQRSDDRNSRKYNRALGPRDELHSRFRAAEKFEARRNNQRANYKSSETRKNIKSTNYENLFEISETTLSKNQLSGLNQIGTELDFSGREVDVTVYNSSFKHNLMLEDVPYLSLTKHNADKHFSNIFNEIAPLNSVQEEATTIDKWTSVSSLIKHTISLAWEIEDDTTVAVIGSVAFMLFSSKVK